MAFTDQGLRFTMEIELVDKKVMIQEQLKKLIENSTENDVREILSASQLDKFDAYWKALGTWMSDNGGNINETSGTKVPGREGGEPKGIALKAVYNDAFRDVNQHIGNPNFSKVKAVSSQLRFISHILGQGSSSV